MQRKAKHDGGYLESPREARYGPEIVLGVAVALECKHGLGGDAQLIGHSHADAPGPEVQPEIAWWQIAFQKPGSALPAYPGQGGGVGGWGRYNREEDEESQRGFSRL